MLLCCTLIQFTTFWVLISSSYIWQLKIMADRVPEASLISRNYGSGYTSDSPKLQSIDNTTSNLLPSQLSESNGNLSNPVACNGNNTLSEKVEWVEQAEPGVYFSISSLPGGDKCLRRVCFRYGKPLTHVIFYMDGLLVNIFIANSVFIPRSNITEGTDKILIFTIISNSEWFQMTSLFFFFE